MNTGPLIAALLALMQITPCYSQEALVDRYLGYPKLTRITEQQIDMEEYANEFCRDMGQIIGLHIQPGIHIYLNDAALQVKNENLNSIFPVGSVIVKEKFNQKNAVTPSLITVMEKVANRGKVSDWRYSMISVPDQRLITGKAKPNCQSCHVRYRRDDFVSPYTLDNLKAYFLRTKSMQEPHEQFCTSRNLCQTF